MKTFPHDRSGNLFDHVVKKYGLKNDAELSRKIGMSPGEVSRVRNGIRGLSAANMLSACVKAKIGTKLMYELINKEAE